MIVFLVWEYHDLVDIFATRKAAETYVESARRSMGYEITSQAVKGEEPTGTADDDQERNCRHEWNQTDAEADESGTRIYCLKCGADGDA